MIVPGTSANQQRDLSNVSVTVKLDGKNITMNPGGLISLSVYLEWNRIPTAKLVFADGQVEKQVFEKSNLDTFSPGKKVELLLGYNQQEESIFKGIITRHSVKIQEGSPFKLEIECRDLAVKTTLVNKSRYYYKQSDTTTIQEIIQDYTDLKSGKMEDTKFQLDELVQYQSTDWDFMLLRADANGMYLNVSDGTINLQKPELKSKPDLQVQFGMGSSGIQIIEFESDIDIRNHYPEVKASTWDQSNQELLQESSEGSFSSSIGATTTSLSGLKPGGAQKDFPDVLYKNNPVKLYHGGEMDSELLSAWVNAKMQRGKLSRIRGRVAIPGIKASPGDTLEVNGISDRFNGPHIITGVMHQMNKGQWRTDIQFGWDKQFIGESQDRGNNDASGLVAGIRGLHIGIVSKIEGDEQQGDHRIQVRIPFVAQNPNNTQADGIWARLSNIYAGAKRGFVFRPEIGDEVIVGFINNDPNDAVILGALNSSNNEGPSEIASSDKNPKKGFISKSGMQMLFDDDEEKISISTGGNNSPTIEMDGKGQKIKISLDSSNSIELSSSGIKINGTRIDLN